MHFVSRELEDQCYKHLESMGLNKRSIYSYKFKDPKLDSLQELVSQLHPVYKINFGKDYGNLLSLLNKEADPLVLLTLAQFYDSPIGFSNSTNVGGI